MPKQVTNDDDSGDETSWWQGILMTFVGLVLVGLIIGAIQFVMFVIDTNF